ncbi:hypothetical protein KB20921_00210 [Edwardsiella ictaluri]|uniref:Uncharacterized protein n=1 Tax=Edwardsiella ictaluri (strain 93-146) TaxID=634503 RepID=C5B9A4_EDWI9|nr:hypothetical protein NT01EI_0024 [Edwardsiella ictaluri 93-146]BEH97293.1 hypothetical protein KH20906_00210 [Edwardsiella ictaluri]BEI00760.1 hypothetical protein KB20921_00210 [Edwardsiella ictaluri]BEI04235.1 hypothetical protein KH201010_00210 [Edwardsiella ictaluri]BEI07690.1 hypothetical protein STU22726_00210 [Edwardsiella ictaluri]
MFRDCFNPQGRIPFVLPNRAQAAVYPVSGALGIFPDSAFSGFYAMLSFYLPTEGTR